MKYRFQCAECGYAYKSFWYEPNWIAKRFYLADHESFHYDSWLNDYPSQWKRHGAEVERERTAKWMEQFIPDGHLEHEECDDCLVIRTVIAWLKEE
jgi:predicted amidophosphoribosyltransferase